MGKKSCQCSTCVECCKHQPGWFAPGEAEKAAEFLGVPFEEFKSKYLIKDFWVAGAHVYAPRKVGVEQDQEVASYRYAFESAPCIFLKDNKCSIHPVKPLECKVSFGCKKEGVSPRRKISNMWMKEGNPLDPSKGE